MAHAQKLILRGGERGIECINRLRRVFEEKRTESLLECRLFEHDRKPVSHFTNGFRRTFCGGPPQNSEGSIAVFKLVTSLHVRFYGGLLDAICLSMTRQNLFMDTRRRLWKSAVEIASLTRGFSVSRADTYIHIYILFLLSNLNYKLDMPADSIS